MIYALVGTGTAGHIYAAIALAEILESRGHDVHFIASEHGVENKLIKNSNSRLYSLPSKPFFRVNTLNKCVAVLRFCQCIRLARNTLKSINADVVIGFGGHVSAATIIAAKTLGMTTAIHEANALAGRGNRIVKHAVDKIFLGDLANHLVTDTSKEKRISLPIRSTLTDSSAIKTSREENTINLLVIGGSEGSDFLNSSIPSLLKTLADQSIPLKITHICGPEGSQKVQARYASREIDATVIDYVDQIETLYAQTDFVISSAGAGTLAELCLWGIPFFLIPLRSAAENHQEENALRFLSKLNLSVESGQFWIKENEWNEESISQRLIHLIKQTELRRNISDIMRQSARPDAAYQLADELELLVARS